MAEGRHGTENWVSQPDFGMWDVYAENDFFSFFVRIYFCLMCKRSIGKQFPFISSVF